MFFKFSTIIHSRLYFLFSCAIFMCGSFPAFCGSVSVICSETVKWEANPVGSISIGKEVSSNVFGEGKYTWQEDVYLTDSNIVLSVKALLDYSEGTKSKADYVSPSGHFCFFIYVNREGKPEKHISISRADSLVTLKSLDIDNAGHITLANDYEVYESPELVGLMYGIMIRNCFDKVQEERNYFKSYTRTLEEIMFHPIRPRQGQTGMALR